MDALPPPTADELEAERAAQASAFPEPDPEPEPDPLAAIMAAAPKPAKPKTPAFDLPDVSHIPDEPVFKPLPLGGSALDDEIKKMRKGSSPFVKVMGGLIVLSGIGIGGFGYYSYQQQLHAEDRLNEINEMTDSSQVVPALIEELRANRFPEVRQRILRNLGSFEDPSAVPAIIEQLQYPGPVRRDAAAALASIGLPGAESAKQALLDVLPRCDARDRGQVVWTLVVLGESRAADAIIESFGRGELQGMRGFEPKMVARVVGVQRLSQPALLNHESSMVRQLVAMTLSEIANPEAAAPLKALLEAELARPDASRSNDVIRAAASGLGRTGSPEAARPLFAVLTSKPEMRADILNALGKSTAAPQLAGLLREATDPILRRELTKLLAATHDPRAAEGLALQLTSDDLDTRGNAALGLAELSDPRALGVLSELANLRDHDDLRRRGLAALTYVSSPQNTRQLIALMESSPATKASVLRALGRSRDPSMASVLVREIEGPDADPAAYALGELNDAGAFQQVLRLAPRPTRVNMAATNDAERNSANQALIMSRRAAIIALGRYGRPDAFAALSTIVEDAGDDYELRSRAGQSIGQVASVEQLRTVIEKIKTPGVPNATREYYAHALWQRPHADLNDELLGLVSSALPDSLRMSAAVAVGYAANPASQPRLMEMLEEADTERFAAVAIGMMGDETAIGVLRAKLKRDHDLADAFKTIMDPEGNSAVQGNRVAVVTTAMFETGSIYRRIAAAWYLRQGEGEEAVPYVWTRLVSMFTLGYDGAGAAGPHEIREALWTAISSHEDEQVRIMAGRMLNELHERGLLLRARDTEGVAEEAARYVLREIAEREARAAGAVGTTPAAGAEE